MTFSWIYTDYSAQHPLRLGMSCDCTLCYGFPNVPALLCVGFLYWVVLLIQINYLER